ncbi:MAG: ABC transporter permease [Propionivibrio sp.]
MLKRHEFVLTLAFIVMVIVIGSINPAFYSIGNIFSLLKSTVIMGIFSLGVLIVIISGNTDISFTAISAFAMYTTGKIMLALVPGGGLLVAFLIAGSIGTLVGFVNAAFVAHFKLPALIVSLGTASAIRGLMLAFIGVRIINNLPPALVEFSKSNIVELTDSAGRVVGLPSAFLVLVVLALGVWLLLKFTMLGRAIYALGGDPVATERAGFNITGIQYFIYGFVGFLSGIAGVLHSAYMRNANPFDLVGTELTVIAAVVLGGASITGGKGTVYGTLVGVAFLVLMENSLIVMGIPSYWQKVVTGLIIIIGTGATALRQKAQATANA